MLLLRSLPTRRLACFASIPCCKPAHGVYKPAHGVCKPAHCVYKPVHGVCKPAFSDRSNPVCYYYGRYRHADLPATRASHVASQHTVCTSQHTVCASQHTVCTSPYTVCASQHLATVVIQCVITTVATDTPTGLLREHPMLQASTRCVQASTLCVQARARCVQASI